MLTVGGINFPVVGYIIIAILLPYIMQASMIGHITTYVIGFDKSRLPHT